MFGGRARELLFKNSRFVYPFLSLNFIIFNLISLIFIYFHFIKGFFPLLNKAGLFYFV